MTTLTNKRSKPRRRRDDRSPAKLAAMGAAVMLLVLGFVAFGIQSITGVPGVGYRYYFAALPDIGNLSGHSDVRIAGVRVGQVLSPQVIDDHARIQIQLQPGVGAMHADATVEVRGEGLLGARYLEINPGSSPRLLPDGATIPAQPGSSITYGVPDALDTFNEQTRGRLRDLLGGLGDAVAGRGEGLNNVIRIGPDITAQLNETIDAITARGDAAQRFLPATNSAMTALDAASGNLAALLPPTAATFRSVAEEHDTIARVLQTAPPALSATTHGLGSGERLLTATRSLALAVNGALPAAPAALRSTAALLNAAQQPLRRTEPLLMQLGSAVPSVLTTMRALRPNLVPVDTAVTHLLPLVRSLGTYSCDVANFADNWRSALGYGAPSSRALPGGDAGNFNEFRVNVNAGPQSLGSLVPGLSNSMIDTGAIYQPPCTHSPGPIYTPLGTAATGGGL